MDYQNRQPEEGINVDTGHPLPHFLSLFVKGLLALLVLIAFLYLLGGQVAQLIPFSAERWIMERWSLSDDNLNHPQMTRYLNELAEDLLENMPLPEGMSVSINYVSEPVFNAFATLGGELLFYRGLLARMPNENALAMVLAHEIAHVLHRDPIRGLGGGLLSQLGLQLIIGGNTSLSSSAALLSQASFTRRMEKQADAAALEAIAKHYGHVYGAADLFILLQQKRSGVRPPMWLERFTSTHPLDEDRIDAIARQAKENGWAQAGSLTPLPDEFGKWF